MIRILIPTIYLIHQLEKHVASLLERTIEPDQKLGGDGPGHS
jgi:hypothetical protein